MTLTDLIAAIEAAPQEDRSLDWEIWRQIMPAHYVSALDTPPRYTRSVDAALTLVPEGLTWKLTRYEAVLYSDKSRIVAEAATPALALCAAALCARIP